MPPKSLAQDLFEDMGRKVAEASEQEADINGNKVVDEIESLCMNCHENVCLIEKFVLFLADTNARGPRAFS